MLTSIGLALAGRAGVGSPPRLGSGRAATASCGWSGRSQTRKSVRSVCSVSTISRLSEGSSSPPDHADSPSDRRSAGRTSASRRVAGRGRSRPGRPHGRLRRLGNPRCQSARVPSRRPSSWAAGLLNRLGDGSSSLGPAALPGGPLRVLVVLIRPRFAHRKQVAEASWSRLGWPVAGSDKRCIVVRPLDLTQGVADSNPVSPTM
jgi:hypothetical protein